MLPVYKAISFQRIIEKGGRSKPWLVLIDKDSVPVAYVVKIFSKDEIDNDEKVVKEVLGSIIATMLSLPVPEPALIDFHSDYNFVSTINDIEAQIILSSKDRRLKFGCKYMEGYYPYVDNSLQPHQLREVIEIDSVFAFDLMIKNRDRGNNKTNFLIRGDSTYLIDHELAFQDITPEFIGELLKRYYPDRFYMYHIFYNPLKRSKILTKKEYFSEIEEYINTLTLRI